MKKISLLLLAVIITTASYSQVVKYKTIETKVNEAPWTAQAILVVVDIDRLKIHIYAQTESDIDVLELTRQIDDESGTMYYFKAVDQNGIRCDITMKAFFDKSLEHVATIILTYSNAKIAYRLKKD